MGHVFLDTHTLLRLARICQREHQGEELERFEVAQIIHEGLAPLRTHPELTRLMIIAAEKELAARAQVAKANSDPTEEPAAHTCLAERDEAWEAYEVYRRLACYDRKGLILQKEAVWPSPTAPQRKTGKRSG